MHAIAPLKCDVHVFIQLFEVDIVHNCPTKKALFDKTVIKIRTISCHVEFQQCLIAHIHVRCKGSLQATNDRAADGCISIPQKSSCLVSIRMLNAFWLCSFRSNNLFQLGRVQLLGRGCQLDEQKVCCSTSQGLLRCVYFIDQSAEYVFWNRLLRVRSRLALECSLLQRSWVSVMLRCN